MNKLLLCTILAFSMSANANSFTDGEYTYTADELHMSLNSDVRSICRRKATQCGDKDIYRVKDKDKAAYTQIAFNSTFDFLFRIDCKNKNKKTTTYLCHLKITPTLVPNGLKFQTSPAQIVEMN